MNKLIAAAVAGILLVGCGSEATDRPSNRPSDFESDFESNVDPDALVELVWDALGEENQASACLGYAVMSDDEIMDYMMSPPDAMSYDQAESFLHLMREEC